VTAFSGVSSATAAGAAGPALPAITFSWDGAATPTLTDTGDVVISGQALAGFAGIPASLLSAAQAGGKNSNSALSPT
jgi:hypothetical protein